MDKIVYAIQSVGHFISNFTDAFVNIGSFLLSILGFVYYAGKTLIVGVYKLITYITGTALFVDIGNTFIYLSNYIGPWGVLFISSLLLIIFIRIIYAFIHKMIFKPDYSMTHPGQAHSNREPTDVVEDVTYPRLH